MVNNISWNQFSEQYLVQNPENHPIQANKFYSAVLQYLDQHQAKALSPEGKKTLKDYAFLKAGIKYTRKTLLTQNEANEVFSYYQQALSSLKMEVKSEEEFNKPAKPKLPKGLEGLATYSATVVEKYLEPQQKAKVQELLNQANKIEHVAKTFFKGETEIDFQKQLTLELLAKQLAYFNPKEGEKYQIPINGKMVEYQVEEVPLWMGMIAYGFKPVNKDENASPILVFSGTRLGLSARGSLASVTADLDPRGVGYVAYSNGKKEIGKWLKKMNGNVLITGHSLGGALARYTLIDHPSLVQGAFTFSAPGIAASYGEKWKKLKKELLQECPFLCNFNHSEDEVPTFGQNYLGKNFQAICAVEKTVNPKSFAVKRKTHYKRLFARKITLFCEIKPKKSMSVWKQRAITVIPFIFCMALLYISRLLFGIHTSKPYESVFGPLRWTVRKLVTEKYAPKCIADTAAAA